jgi:hypothetical protein
MGWLQRIFGQEKPAAAKVNPAPATADIPAAKVGLSGEFDESGLAKRVALAFDAALSCSRARFPAKIYSIKQWRSLAQSVALLTSKLTR